MLDKLNKKQLKLMNEIRDRNIHHFLNSGYETNEKICRPLINKVYEKLGLEPPKIFIAEGYLSQKEMINNILHNLEHDNKKNEFVEHWFGSWNAGWLSFYEFFKEIGIIKSKDFDDYNKLQKQAFSIVYYDTFVVLCKLPIKTLRDDQNRLHSVESSAIKWRDHTENYFIHGVPFDKELWTKVTKRTITSKEALTLENTDQRFVALQHIGFEKILDSMDKVLLDRSSYGNDLYSTQFADGIELRFLTYPDIDNPRRKRISFVDPSMDNADEAMAWKHNCSVDEYHNMEILRS